MSRTISVKGRAMVKAPADITGVETSVRGHEKKFQKAIVSMTETTKRLKDAIESAGIPRDQLKTTDVSVKQAYRKKKIGTDRYGDDKFEDVPDGFEYYQNVRFEFKNDNEKLSKAIAGILECGVEPKITFYFKSSDLEGMKNKALHDACVNAKNEAETIVGSVGARLGKLLSVERNVSHGYYDDYDDVCKCKTAMKYIGSDVPTVDIDPEDASVDQEVVMIWEIED